MRPAWPFVFASWYWVIARAGFSQDVGNTAQQRPCLTCQCLCMGIPNMTELCELHYANMSTSNLSNVFKICYAGTSPIALFTAFICLWGPCRRGIADEWKAKLGRGFFAAGKRRAAVDAAWRAATAGKGAVGPGQVAASCDKDVDICCKPINYRVNV